MKFAALLIFCGTVRSIPVNGQHPVPYLLYEDKIVNEDEADLERNISDQCFDQIEFYENYGEPSRLTLPTLQSVSNDDNYAPQEILGQDIGDIVARLYSQPKDFDLPYERTPAPPRVPLSWSWTPDDMNHIQDPMHNEAYEVSYQLPPYTFDNVLPPLTSLPPVSTKIHESLAEIENNYQTNYLDIDNDLYLAPNFRAVRSRGEELLLDQLKHDAIIPNILPTMPVPFVRGADFSPVYQDQDATIVMVLYPGRVPDCGLPLLFGCTPKMIFGGLEQTPDDGYPVITSADSGIESQSDPDTFISHEVNNRVE